MSSSYASKPKWECGCGWSLKREPRARQVQGGRAETRVGDRLNEPLSVLETKSEPGRDHAGIEYQSEVQALTPIILVSDEWDKLSINILKAMEVSPEKLAHA